MKMPNMAERKKERPTDLLERAREAARRELDALRAKQEKPVKQTILTGYGRSHAHL